MFTWWLNVSGIYAEIFSIFKMFIINIYGWYANDKVMKIIKLRMIWFSYNFTYLDWMHVRWCPNATLDVAIYIWCYEMELNTFTKYQTIKMKMLFLVYWLSILELGRRDENKGKFHWILNTEYWIFIQNQCNN